MLIKILSDLHLDMYRDKGKLFISSLDPHDGLLILAGDITSMRNYDVAYNHIKQLADRHQYVFMVHGNHESYFTTPQNTYEVSTRLEANIPNFSMLNTGARKSYGGHNFIGGTLWFKNDPLTMTWEKRQFNDFSVIKLFEPWVYNENALTIKNLQDSMRENDILITHHVPSSKSIHSSYKGDPANKFFLCDIEQIIIDKKPKLAIHGHTHYAFNYMIESTSVICNPKGYEHEFSRTNNGFSANLVVEI